MAHFKKQMITLFVSSECNLNCEYCYVPHFKELKNEHKRIDVEFARIAIKAYFEKNEPYIRFFGAGEPTVAFDEMREIYDYSKKLAPTDLKAELQTNGCFSDDIANWIEKNINILWISFDGLPELNNIQRPNCCGISSSEVVISNIKRFIKIEDKMQVGVRMTITNDNLDKQIDMIDYLHSIGVKYICGSPCYTSTANENVVSPYTLEFAKNFVPAYKHARKLSMFYQTHFIINFDRKIGSDGIDGMNGYCRACIPSPHVTTDGHISCCDWALFGSEYLPGPLQQLVYGTYDPITKTIKYNNDKIERIRKRNINTLRDGACRGCAALEKCAGGCVGKNIVVTGDLFKPFKDWCFATQYLLKNLPPQDSDFPCFHS